MGGGMTAILVGKTYLPAESQFSIDHYCAISPSLSRQHTHTPEKNCLCSSYTAAFGVTVGVGCLLLILNIVIFAGIYYQRERLRRKSRGTRSGAAAAAAAATANNGHHQHHHHHHHQQAAASGIMPIDAVDVGDDEDGDDVEVGIASQHNSDLHRHGAAAGGGKWLLWSPSRSLSPSLSLSIFYLSYCVCTFGQVWCGYSVCVCNATMRRLGRIREFVN